VTLAEVLALLGKNSIRVGLEENGQLKISAAKGAMTPELMGILKQHRDLLLAWATEKQQEERSQLPAISPLPRNQHFPLSFNQRRLWLLQKLAPDSVGYNMPLALRLAGRLDLPALECAINALLQRHEVFRTILVEEGEECFQQIVELPRWVAVPETSEGIDKLLPLVQQEAATPFALTGAPLYRIRLWETGSSEWLILVTLHHLIADAISIEILLSDLATLYREALGDSVNPLPPLAIHYADFSWWQQHVLQEGGYLQKQLAYWQQQLQGAPTLLHIPTDRPRSATMPRHGRIVRRKLDPALVMRVRDFGRESGLHPLHALPRCAAAGAGSPCKAGGSLHRLAGCRSPPCRHRTLGGLFRQHRGAAGAL
jgi:hypothetical protein